MRGAEKWAEANARIEGVPFRVIKRCGDSEDLVRERVRGLVSDVGMACRHREGSVNLTLMGDPAEAHGRVERFLKRVILRMCGYSESVTCVIEPDHVDSVHRDLYVNVYAREYFDTGRNTIRLSFFRALLDEDSFFLARGNRERWDLTPSRKESGSSLQDLFMGSVVVIPRCGGTIGRTLLDPRWVSEAPLCVRLTDFAVTIRGKRLYVQAFPYRGQDGEAMSCGETTIMSLLCYYSNEFGEYPITMPRTVLTELERTSAERVTPSQGLSYDSVGRVLSSVGFFPRRYEITGMLREQVPGEFVLPTDRMRQVAWSYVCSGIPVAVNVQPEGDEVGHSLVLVGMEDDYCCKGKSVELEEAERIEDDNGSHLVLIDEANLDAGRRFCVIDDSQVPYQCRSWSALSSFRWMMPTEMIVPTTKGMALGAMDARDVAGEIFRSPMIGLLTGSKGVLAGKQLVMTQRMVSMRSYLRQRVDTCDPKLAYVWEGSPFPRWAWLFECIESRWWEKAPWERRAVAELLLDATAVTPGDPSSRIALLRYPGFLHYHSPSGEGIVDEANVPYDFVAYDRSLRHVGVEADRARQQLKRPR